ncbi:MAG: sugar transferase [Chthoniobacterales bacterium]
MTFLDVASWIVIFRLFMLIRGTTENTSPMAWFASCSIGLMVTIGALYIVGGYNPRRDQRTLIFAAEFILSMLAAAALSFVFIYAMATYSQGIRPSRSVLLSTFLTFPLVALFYRRLIAGWYWSLRKTREFLVIGGGTLAQNFSRAFRKSSSTEKLRFVSDEPDVFSQPIDGEGSPVINRNVLEHVRNISSQVAGIVIAEEPGKISAALTDALLRLHFESVPVYTLESFYETFWQKVPVMALDPVWPLQKGFPLSTDTHYASFKRILDILFALAALTLLAPIFGIVALIIRLESRGSIIFKQERVGWHRRSFMVLKFRTMYEREEEGSLYTQSNDSRITPSGRWLRKLRLDELPQLWNVLIGDMSVIGPRAEWIKCVALYEDYIPSYHFRHLVKPGITGWAQVNYPYGANLEDAIQKLKYDLYYIRHYSLKLDAMIVLKTIHVIFLAKGK